VGFFLFTFYAHHRAELNWKTSCKKNSYTQCCS
jgi:hypothetical protein